jgi:hypothetical protein
MEAGTGPIELTDRVVVAGGGAGTHRAWPGAEVAANGDLLVAYKDAPDHARTDAGAVFLTRSTDGGRTWRPPTPVAAEPGWCCITDHGLTRLSDGSLLLPIIRERTQHPPHAEGGVARESHVSFTRSTDGGHLWEACGSEVHFPELNPHYVYAYGRAQELSDGRLMAPFVGVPRRSRHARLRSSGVAFSSDQGHTWSDFTLIHEDLDGDVCPNETDVLRLRDGRFLAMVRSNPTLRLYQSYSDDEGHTWTPLRLTPLPGQSPALIALASGDVLCAYRDVRPEQYGMSCAVSTDAGETWEPLGYLYKGANRDCAYPSMVRLPDGTIFCAFYTAAEPAWTGSCEIHGLFLRDRTAY